MTRPLYPYVFGRAKYVSEDYFPPLRQVQGHLKVQYRKSRRINFRNLFGVAEPVSAVRLIPEGQFKVISKSVKPDPRSFKFSVDSLMVSNWYSHTLAGVHQRHIF